ncbi:Hypothetical protein PHPALM_15891 [Phytophthora palmivora]|uniref:Uncharacterized protein n=1 Tax=Phytophthora palmivora TaxID=4796 RepID=A0A2P4XR21_9STRA|nr:Hypothetical protein PHPALM_15891 [Phytophthora palmivora]
MKFVLWLHINMPEVVTTQLNDRLNEVRQTEDTLALKEKNLSIKHFMRDNSSQPPVDLLRITPENFECFLMSLRKKNGKRPSKSVYSSMRSSLFHLYRIYNVKMPVAFGNDLKCFFKGLKRTVARRQAEEGESLIEGKVKFPFSLYQLLCKEMRKQTKKKFVFAHAFLVISWNLMCRPGNSVSIRYEHLEWDEDALAIWFAHMKNDQEGERQRDPRHVYANPKEPNICPILALAIYFTVFGFNKNSLLFPGRNQYDRYSKILQKTLEITMVARELEISAAGDSVVGRFVSGLPYETPDFAILPPFFEDLDENVWDAVNVCFPSVPSKMKKVCFYLLGSLVYHYDHLAETLDMNHVLWTTPLFRDVELLRFLKQKVVCRRWIPGDVVRASGVPPHLGVIVNMENRLDKVDKKQQNLDISREENSDTLTPVDQHVHEVPEQSTHEDGEQITTLVPSPRWRHHGTMNGFTFPKVPLMTAWELWWFGCPSKGWPPFRALSPIDLPNKNTRKRLSDFRFVMMKIESISRQQTTYRSNPSLHQARQLLSKAMDLLPIEEQAQRKYTRRKEQLQWSTVVNLLRRYKRSQQVNIN